MAGLHSYVQSYHRRDQGTTPGRRPLTARSAAETVHRDEYRGWRIEILCREIGAAICRKQYSARVYEQADPCETSEYLPDFASQDDAMAAARVRIDAVETQSLKVAPPRRRGRRENFSFGAPLFEST